jgi:CHAT domain-containing protein
MKTVSKFIIFMLLCCYSITTAQKTILDKCNKLLSQGKYKKVGNELKSLPLPNRADDLIKLGSLQILYGSITNNTAEITKGEDIILKNGTNLNSIDKNNVFEGLNFAVKNLIKAKQYALGINLLKQTNDFISPISESNVQKLDLIATYIEALALAGYNSEAKTLIEKTQNEFEQLEPEKKNKEKIDTYNDYLISRGVYEYQYGMYEDASKYFSMAQKRTTKSNESQTYYKALLYKAKANDEIGIDKQKTIRQIRNSFFFRKNKRSQIKLDLRAKIVDYYAQSNKDLRYLRNKYKYNFALIPFKSDNPLKFKTQLFDVERLQSHNSFQKAYNLQKNASKTGNIDFNTKSPYLLDLLKYQYVSCIKTHQYKEASDTLASYLNKHKYFYGEKSPEYSQAKMLQAEFLLLYSNDLESANKILTTDYEKNILANYSEHHLNAASNSIVKANYLQETDEYNKEVALLENAKKITDKDSSVENKIKVNESLSEAYVLNGNYDKAENLISSTIEMINAENKKSKQLNSVAYLDLAKFNLAMGKLQEAKKNVNTAKKLAKKSKYDTELILGNSLDEQASLLIEFSKFNKAEDLLKDNLEYKTKLFGKENKGLIETYNSLAKVMLLEGKYSEAEEYVNKSITLSKTVYGTKSLKYAASLSMQQELYSSLGDFKKATNTAQEIYKIRQEKLGENHIKTADALENVAANEFLLDNSLDKSLKDIETALNVYKKNNLTKHPYYANILTNKAYMMIYKSDYDQANQLLNQSVEILTSTVGNKSVKLAETYLVLGNLARDKGNFSDAEKHINNAKNIYKSNFGENHPSYVKCLSALGKIQYIEGKVDNSLATLIKTTSMYLKFTDTYFKYLSSKEKLKFWNSIKDDFEFLNFIVVNNNKTEYYKTIYENTLRAKGLLLSNSQNIIKIINKSDNQELKDKFKDWVLKKEDLRNLITQGGDGEDFNNELLKLEAEIVAIEKDLSNKSSEFKKVISSKEPSFTDVQNTLSNDEAVFEMIRYRKFNKSFGDSVVYAAFIFDKKSKKPKIVKIVDGEKLETKYLSYYRNALKNKFEDKHSYSKFWKDFDGELKAYKSIYYSPEGVYNMLNINTLKDETGQYVLDKYVIVNLSNSKDIYKNRNIVDKNEGDKTATIVAGPDFYEGTEGKTIARLQGAEKEGVMVSNLLKNGGYKVNYYTGLDASKDLFKALNSPTILHIATHGEFKEETVNSQKNLMQLEFLQDPLFKSNLLFAKAGDYIEGKKTMTSPLLSAHEVMDLSLNGTKTVVLSACETGLGAYTVGEGVYGLKRAFLVAGAESVFTSLFKVADEVTAELFENFYKYYTKENYSKEKAFHTAQKDIMKKYPEPIFWGSFILTGNK